MSKMLDDKSRPSTSNVAQEKRRSRSPSSLIEFAQRKLPKWASFIKKSEEDCESSTKIDSPDSSKLKRINIVNEKSKSAEEYDRRNKFIPPKPHSSEEYDRETRYKGILRRKAVEDSVDVVESEKLQTPSSSKGIVRKSPEINEPRSTNRLYAFTFLGRSKERKDTKLDSKIKHKAGESDTPASLSPSKDLEKLELNPNKRPQQDLKGKRPHRSETKQTSFEEKTKSFFKQKSRDKSNESSRKNSVNFGVTLKEKSTKLTRTHRQDSIKAISAETLEGMGTAIDGFVQGEFLAASMRLLLVVSPPFTRFPIRSRSLSNLDALDSRRTRLLDNHFMARMLFGVRPASLPLWYSSLPEINAENYTRRLAYQPGLTRRRTAFVRHSKTNIRRFNSESSLTDFFQLTLPASFESDESLDEEILEYRRFLNNTIFVPAIGNVTLRKAAKKVFQRRQNYNVANFSARINGSLQLFDPDIVDTGRLGGAHITLHDTSRLRMFRKPSFERLPKPPESVKISSPASTYKESKTPLSQKLKWSNIFKSKTIFNHFTGKNQLLFYLARRREIERGKPEEGVELREIRRLRRTESSSTIECEEENTANMEKLSTILNKFSKELPPLPADKQVKFTSSKAYNVLTHLIAAPFESVIDPTGLKPEEERLQRTIFELITTEAEYIDNVKTLIEVFLSVALYIQGQNLMLELDIDRLFLNITEVLQCNILLWETTFYPMVADVILCKSWVKSNNIRFNFMHLYNGFGMFESLFHKYKLYVENQQNSHVYSKQLVEESSLFAAYLAWCEAHKNCHRLRLSDLLVKPMQRLTKYGLLLNSVHGLLVDEPEKFTVKKICCMVRKFTYNLNCHIRYIEEIERMNYVTEIIDSFDGVETKDEEVDIYLRLHTNLNLKLPIIVNNVEYHRAIVLEGELKFKDSREKVEVKCVLFMDFLLLLLPSRRKKSLFKVIRPKIMVKQMQLYPQYLIKDGIKSLAHLIVITVDSTGTTNGWFSLHDANKDSSQPSVKDWLFALKEAQITMEMLENLNHDPREEYYDIETCNQAAEFRLKNNSTDEDGTILEPMEAMMPAITVAAKKRLCTLMQGTEAPKDGSIPEAPEIISIPIRPSSLRSQSFNSSLQRSYSGSYECNDWEAVGNALRGGSGDTSAGRRTISLSSEEGPTTASLIYDAIIESRPPLIVTHSPIVTQTNSTKNAMCAVQTIATIEPIAHCSKNPPPVVTKIVRTQVPVKENTSSKKSPKVNTLSVEPEHCYSLRQSMPNLSVPMINTLPFTPGTSRHCLNVPTQSTRRVSRSSNIDRRHLGPSDKFLSPDSRGTSYPPPSTSRASLRRGYAFSSSGHPS